MFSLPKELQYLIMSYITYPQQDKTLCADILHFSNSFCKIRNVYDDLWGWTGSGRYDWLYNDIVLFLNNNLPTLYYGYSLKIINIINRGSPNITEENIGIFFKKLDKKNPILQSRYLWGLMNERERDTFYDFVKN